ncbi:MAG: gliding motility-associated C-terminal domain-containing protein [Bacteroidetes bacterium]|nr:gliding motility-associated C-terminal domain-containing protein [Bacteroidota bacterium]
MSTNTCGSIESNIITVTVYNEINGGTIAANQSVCYGDVPAPFSSVTAPSGGNGAWTYQWQFQVGAGAWTDIAGANAITYAAPGPMTVTTNYRRLSTNTCGTGISNVITVTVADAINGGVIAASQSICYNTVPAPFTSVSPASGGTGAMTYQWQSQTGVGPWTNIVGATGLTYSVPSGLTITTNYRRVATNACGSGESNIITVTVSGDINGGTIAASQDICYNTTPAPFTNILSPSGGVGAWTYQWQSQVGAGPWTNIAGANGLAYTVSSPLTVTTNYKRVATNSCGVVESNVITVSVYGVMNGGVIAASQSICNGDIPAPFTNSTSPSGGFGAWTYQWQYQVGAGVWTNIVGANALTYAVSAPLTVTTNYRRVASNSCGTVESNIITVTVADALLGGVIAANQTICYGTIPSPFTSVSPASGGTGAITYQWQFQIGLGPWTNIAGANALTYSVAAPLTTTTNYRRLATNACGNSASNTITITVYGQLNADVNLTHVTGCFGNTNGAISITNPVGGSGVYQYSIDGGATWHNSGLFSGLGAGFYNVQIRDFTLPGCIVNLGVYQIIQPAQLSADLAWQNVTGCSSSLNGWINITNPLGGSGTFEYTINGGTSWSVSGLFSNLGAGTYNVQMRDQANPSCVVILNANLVLTAPLPLTATVSSVNVNCFGANNGSITITNPIGGSGNYEFSINNGASWQASGSFPNLFAGSYTVLIRDASFISCVEQLAVVVITQPAQLNATVNFDQISCFGSNDGRINITNPSGGSGAYEYSINNGATWQASGLFEGLVENTYNVLIRDANNINCFVLLQVVNIIEPDGMILSFLVIDVDCWGASTGEVTVVVVGGTPGYTYLWSNGATTPTISGLTTGNYSVTVTDSQGCTQSGSATVSQPASPLEVYAGPNVTICSGVNLGVWELGGTGSVETAEGGQPPYSYVWSSNPLDPTLAGQENDANPVVSPNVQTVYTVQVTDFYGCVETDFTTIFIYPIVVADAGGGASGEIHLCNGSSVTLGGTPLGIGNTGYYVGNPTIDPNQFTYRWERLNGGIWTFFSNIAHPVVSPATTTTYRVRVRDKQGDNCLAYDTVVVIVTPGLIVTANPDIHDVCNANAAGNTFMLGATINDQGSGLGASAIITWTSSPFDTTLVGQANILNPIVSPTVTTTYTITVDYPVGIGCSSFDSMTIHVSPAIIIDSGGPSLTMCHPNNSGSITLGGSPTASGGTPPLAYLWTAVPADPSLGGQQNLPNPTVSPNVNTTYTLTVTDAQNCQVTDQVAVSILPQLVADAGADVTVCYEFATTIGGLPAAFGGSGNYTYLWTAVPADPSLAGQQNMPNPTVEPLVTTTYTLTVTDATYGCQDVDVVVVNVVPGIDITIYEGANPVCVGSTITLGGSPTATGGNPPLNYRWRIQGVNPNWSELTNPTYTVNENTTFILFVYDNFGCWNSESVTINVTNTPVAQIQGAPIREICEGESVTLTAIGNATWNYLWMPGGYTTQTINVSPTETTTYTLTVTNDCGTDNASVQVIVYPSVGIDVANTSVDDITCSGDENGSINIALLNTSIIYTFNLQDNLGNILETYVGTQPATFIDLGAGTYFVHITDGHACGTMLAGPYMILAPDPITIDPSSIAYTAVICDGDDSGFISIGANGGTGVLYYTLYKDAFIVQGPQAGSGSFTGLEGGTYIVNITDDAGCSIDSDPITIVVIGGLPNAGDDKEVCVGGSVEIGPDVDPGATTYLWTSVPQDLSLMGQENLLNPVVSPLETTTYYLTSVYELDGFTCENVDELIVKVNPLPLALVGDNISMCFGDVVSIGAQNYEPVPANTYVWTSVPHDPSISSPFVSNPTVSPLVTTVYTLIETYVATGCSNSNSVTVTVNPLPSVFVADDMTICQGDEVYIGSDNEPDPNVTYFWSAYPIPFISAEYNPLVSPESTNTYYLTVTHQPTGCINMDSVTVTVVEKPLYEISDNIIFCSVDEIVPVYIGGNPLGAYFYTWTSAPENSSLIGQENDSDPLVTVEGTTMFHLLVSAGPGAEGCVARDSVWVLVSDLNVVAWDSPKACEDEAAELGYGIAVSGGFQPYTYQWYDNDGNLIGNIFNPIVTPPFVEPYTIIVTDYFSCSREADVSIEIDVPVVSLEADPDVNLYPNQVVTFTATPDYYENYDFYVNGVLAQTGSLNTFEYLEPQQDDEIIVIVMSEFGCEASSLPLILNLISLPNAFTPNGDGINDIFGKGSDLIIFNRWGQKIYDGVEGWDGTFNGRAVAPGTYYYIQTVYDRNNNQIINKGSVTVIRIRE